jgi:RNA polymerase sigma factor (TIGR02999 family)
MSSEQDGGSAPESDEAPALARRSDEAPSLAPRSDEAPSLAPRSDVTTLIAAARSGEARASEALYERVYSELKRLAHVQLSVHGRPGQTLDTTALVHETYLRLAGPAGAAPADRAHFFNLAARVMRHVIVDFARRRDAEKRGGGVVPIELEEAAHRLADPGGTLSIEMLALDRALHELERASPDLAHLVELRFFAGLALEEIAPIVDRSERSLKRDWRRAQAFLRAALEGRPLAPAPDRAGPG